jgi:predicted acyltransferase
MMHTATNSLQRNNSLDALRGLAILLMVLSGSIAFGGVLPAWMYHAQVPPPQHKFNPAIPGITWVDLVFPFFLFSMGVAIPLALQKWAGKPKATLQVWWTAIRRYILLTWFALFILHMRAWVIAEQPGTKEYLLSIAAFVLLFFQLYHPKNLERKKLFTILRIAANVVSLLLLYLLPFHKGQGFLFEKSDIIILVLANMAFFGTIIWWHTRNLVWLRVGILPFIMAIFLGGKEAGSFNEIILNWSPVPWIYKFYYLKYLFIIIPGTMVGEWMMTRGNQDLPDKTLHFTGALLLLAIILNVSLLFGRHLLLNLGLTIGIIMVVSYLLCDHLQSLTGRLFTMGSFLLLLGLFFEAYEGGIKKDSSTYSYYFVTTGLSCFMLVVFYSWQQTKAGVAINSYLAANGQNPMVAYVAGSLLLTPVLRITGTQTWLDMLNGNAWTGFLKGIIYTGIVSLLTYAFTKQKWFWKT